MSSHETRLISSSAHFIKIDNRSGVITIFLDKDFPCVYGMKISPAATVHTKQLFNCLLCYTWVKVVMKLWAHTSNIVSHIISKQLAIYT